MAGALTAAIAAAFSGVTPDPYFEYTTLLLPGSGTNGAQNNTFLDGSTNNFTITRNGNTTQGTFSPFSQTGWGNYFDGSSVLLNTTTTSSGFNLSTGSFTIEGWIYLTSVSSYQYLINLANTAGATSGLVFGINPSGQPYIGNGVVLGKSGSTAISANTWTHIAVVSDGTNIQFYTNGSSNGSAQAFSPNTAQYFYIGRDAGGSNALSGYISNLRVTKGRAVYSGASYDVPTSPLTRTMGGANPPQGTECSLLTCQSNRFLDSNGVNTPASSPLTITASGSPRVVAFSPFNPTASWSAATYGGSGYFDGSGDYLSLTATEWLPLGTENFTIDFWFYLSSWPGSFSNFIAGSANNSLSIYYNSTDLDVRVSFVGVSALLLVNRSFINLNSWNHYALVRSSNNWSVWINGTRRANTTNTSSFVQSAGSVGAFGSPLYLSSVRIVRGSAIYDPTQTTITVPTAPLTAITNTSLLLNFTNAGIYDATSKNDLETVGDAQISNAITPKWGSTSIKFDGTGDWLLAPSSQNCVFGTGNFTVEFWIYPTQLTSSVDYNIIDFRNASDTTSFRIGINGSTVPFVANTGGILGGSFTFSTNTWYYMAVTRNNGTLTIWVDGSSVGSNTTTTNFTGAIVTVGASANPVTRGPFFGYMQDLRVTLGYARTITTPTAAFPTL